MYDKGVRRRQQILDAALEVFAAEGYSGTSLREVAARCGLTVAGLMHYFESREDLLTEVIIRRDQTSRAAEPVKESPWDILGVLEQNASEPGLVELFVSLTAAAYRHDHPAHDSLRRRYSRMRRQLTGTFTRLQESGLVDGRHRPQDLADLLIAIADGAQLQWLVDGRKSLSRPFAVFMEEILGVPRPPQSPRSDQGQVRPNAHHTASTGSRSDPRVDSR